MPDKEFRYFEFGEFRLDARRRLLHKNGEPVHLTPRAFDLLHVLAANAGRVMEHDKLLDKVWEGAFVEQGNLKKTVSTLRYALGEAPDTSEFITTVPRRGYRFVAAVRALPDDALLIRETQTEIIVEEIIEDSPRPLLPETAPRRWRMKRAVWAGGGVLLLALLAWGAWLWQRQPPQHFSAGGVKITRLMSEPNIYGGILSPDGNFFCYVILEGVNKSLWVRHVKTGSTVRIVPSLKGSIWWKSFTPDANYIYYTAYYPDEPAKSGVYRIPTLGGVAQIIVDKLYEGVTVSPDGKALALVRVTGKSGVDVHEILTTNADGGNEKVVLALPDYSLTRGLAWSPDGASLLYGVKKQLPNEKATHYVAEVALAGGAEKVLMSAQEEPFYLAGWVAPH